MNSKKKISPHKINKKDLLNITTIEQYFKELEINKKKYGKDIFLISQFGSFYECYAVIDPDTNETLGTNIEKYCEITRLSSVIKKYKINYNNKKCKYIQVGFPVDYINKYVNYIVSNGFKVVRYDQLKDINNKRKIQRKFVKIYSKTNNYFDIDDVNKSNHQCLYFIKKEKAIDNSKKDKIIFGLSCYNNYSGNVIIKEYYIDKIKKTSINIQDCYELQVFNQIQSPYECTIIHNLSDKEIKDIKQYASILEDAYIYHLDDDNEYSKIATSCESRNTQINILNNYFNEPNNNFMEYTKLDHKWYACQSLCMLLEIIYRHDPELVVKIKCPEYIETEDKLYLANHSLIQLNILNPHSSDTSLCIEKILNKCSTAIGKRRFKKILAYPSTNIDLLNTQYSITEYIINNKEAIILPLRKLLSNINDLERMYRKIVCKKFNIKDMGIFYNNILKIKEIVSLVSTFKPLKKYMDNIITNFSESIYNNNNNIEEYDSDIDNDDMYNNPIIINTIEESYELFLNKIHQDIDIEKCKPRYQGANYFKEEILNIFNNNYNNIDSEYNKVLEKHIVLKHIVCYFNTILATFTKWNDTITYNNKWKDNKNNIKTKQSKDIITNPIKVKDKVGGGIAIHCSKTHSETILRYLEGVSFYKNGTPVTISSSLKPLIKITEEEWYKKIHNTLKYTFLSKEKCINDELFDTKFVKNKSNTHLESKYIDKNCNLFYAFNEIYTTFHEKTFQKFIGEFLNHNKELEIIVKYIEELDCIVNKAYIANKYNYCKPKIQSKKENSEKAEAEAEAEEEKDPSSFFSVEKIRHPLIELIQDEVYTPNDLYLGEKNNGMLLYGVNGVGKSSITRSIGIMILMAQAGLYVAAENLIYYPYHNLYTRILGKDNILKGQSTFAVEMSELVMAVNKCDKHSLILGDEICSGTEHGSALGIFVSAIEEFNKKNATYIFATHFHKISDIDEIHQLNPKPLIKHLSISIDAVTKELIYERILLDGVGKKSYGLEVCKYMGFEKSFTDRASYLRRKYAPEYKGYLENNVSQYNPNVRLGMCVKCNKNKAVEVHHMMPQKLADDRGFINHISKNNKANLMPLCKECHLEITKKDIILKKKRTTNGFIIEGIN